MMIYESKKFWQDEIEYEYADQVPKKYIDACKNDLDLAHIMYAISRICPDEHLYGQGFDELRSHLLRIYGKDDMPLYLQDIWYTCNFERINESRLRDTIKYGKNLNEKRSAIVDHFINNYHIKTSNDKNRTIYCYRDGYYQEAYNFIRYELERVLKEQVDESMKRNVVEAIRDRTLMLEEEKIDRNLINLANGIYSIKDKQILPHSPDHFFTWILPVTYDSEAVCENVLLNLQGLLTESDIQLLQEWMGYCLYRDYGLKKAMILVGEQNTGKSTAIKLFEALVGKENVSGVSLDKLTANTFAVAHLKDKLINLYDDLSYKDVNDNGIFKMVTGNGIVTGEFKFGHQFTFQNYAKLTFACNKIPSVSDTNDDAYFGRWMIIEFNRQIEKPDPNIFTKMSTQKELSGLLNFALEGLERILDQGGFSYKKSEDEIKEQMLKSGSPAAQFAYDCLTESPNGTITKECMIDHYRAYAKERGLPSMTKEVLGRKLPKYATYIDSGKEGPRSRQYSVWQNVSLKEGVLPESGTEDFEFDAGS